jgi:hypothetical protein
VQSARRERGAGVVEKDAESSKGQFGFGEALAAVGVYQLKSVVFVDDWN